MFIRRLKSHFNILARSHNRVAWRPLDTYAAGDRLEGPFNTTKCGKWGVTTHLKRDVIVGTKEERDRVPSSTRAICCAMNGALENVICIASNYEECVGI